MTGDLPAAREFAELARHFCGVVEAPGSDGGALLRDVHPLLARLYAAALALPHADPSDGPGAAGAGAAEDRLRRTLAGLLGERCHYREVFDAYDFEEDPVVGDLADDLASIHRELWDGLRLWDGGRRQDAVWEWRFGFETHWSEHATGALRAIRTLAFVHHLDGPPPRSGEA